MERRETVDEKIAFEIRGSKQYKSTPFCTWKELIAIKGILPDDQVSKFCYSEHKGPKVPFGYDQEDGEETTFYTPTVVVIRPRPENDKEFEERMRTKAQFDEKKEEKEKLEYLRLKAKFEK